MAVELRNTPYLAGAGFGVRNLSRSATKITASLGKLRQTWRQKPAYWPKFDKVILIPANGQYLT